MKAMLLAMAVAAGLGMTVMAAEQPTPGGPMAPGAPGRADIERAGGEISDAISTNPDKAFAAAFVSHARLQRQISDLVAQKATNPQIKKYAQEIADEYDKASTKVQQAAEKEGFKLQADRMLPRDQAVLEFMKQLPPATLERNYIFHQAGAAQSQLLACQWAAKNAEKPGIKEAAQEMVSKLQSRSESAQKLAQAEVNGGSRVAGEE